VRDGTTTTDGTPSRFADHATAYPAFPPDELTSRRAPAATARAHAWPMPRSLNEPHGCDDSIFSHTGRPRTADSGVDGRNGVG
jgi:hypothetical protein